MRSSGKSRQSGSRSHQNSRSNHSPTTSRSHRHSENQTPNATKRRSSRSPKPPSGSAHSRHRDSERKEHTHRSRHSSAGHKERKSRSSSTDKHQLVESDEAVDRLSSSLRETEKKKARKPSRSSSADDIRLFNGDEVADSWSLALSQSENPGTSTSYSRSKRRRKSHAKSTSLSPVSSPTGVATEAAVDGAGAKTFAAKTINEESEANRRERIRDLEVQNDQIQKKMQKVTKNKKGKKGGRVPQDSSSNKVSRITVCKVLGVAAVYLAGFDSGYLVSEIRQRRASPGSDKIFVTQSPTMAVLPSNDPTAVPTELSYNDPSKEDCFAIESKEEVQGQDGMITRSYDVHFDVQLTDSATDWYGQLEEGLTDNVVPDLACCKNPAERRLSLESQMKFSTIRGRSHRMLKNIRCVVANGSTRGEGNDNGDSCVQLTGGFCVPAVVTFDLALKGDEPDGDIIDLVRNVIQGDGSESLVEKFDLERNVFSVVKLVDVVDNNIPAGAPIESSPITSSPSLTPTVTSAPVFGPKTNAPTRNVTPVPTSPPTTPKPTSVVTKSPTIPPVPGITPSPSAQQSAVPSSEPSQEPTDSPSSIPSLVPSMVPSSYPSSSPTTPVPSLMPSTAPSGRRGALEAKLAPFVGTVDAAALDWLADTDTWIPPETEPDPDSMWLERYAMVKLYMATNGDSWTNKGGWMTSGASICDWSADTCNDNDRIRKISLKSNGLSGTIPTEIGLFSDLDYCHAGHNDGLIGTLPTELGLPKLRLLHLQLNSLTGTIPSEIGLTKMTFLDLSNIKGPGITGSVPSEILALSTMKWLFLLATGVTGTISSEIGSSMQMLDLGWNDCSGTLPSELGSLPNLFYLRVVGNDFTGTIPSELGQATSLAKVVFRKNQFTGVIPTTLGQLTRLTHLELDENGLSGTIPTELGHLTGLKVLDLSHQGLNGAIPSELGLLVKLKILDIRSTTVSGTIPDLSALVDMMQLNLDNCQLTGNIPPGMLGNMVNLTNIDFSSNSLTGAIPLVPNPSKLTACSYSDNCFSDVTNAGTCDLTNNCA